VVARFELTDEEYAKVASLLPDMTPRRGGRWRDHRQVINGILFRVRTRRDPERAELLERLARLEAALVERDTRIVELTRRFVELEALLRRDSRTSPRPPSADGPVKPPPMSRRESSGRSPGKQPGVAGFTLRQVEEPDRAPNRPPGTEQIGARPAYPEVGRRVILRAGRDSSN
jgi:hypothetical protein